MFRRCPSTCHVVNIASSSRLCICHDLHLADELATECVDDTSDRRSLTLADKVEVEHALDGSWLETARDLGVFCLRTQRSAGCGKSLNVVVGRQAVIRAIRLRHIRQRKIVAGRSLMHPGQKRILLGEMACPHLRLYCGERSRKGMQRKMGGKRLENGEEKRKVLDGTSVKEEENWLKLADESTHPSWRRTRLQ
nr:hypothetical protein CFP56_11861 [Quercus suber]